MEVNGSEVYHAHTRGIGVNKDVNALAPTANNIHRIMRSNPIGSRTYR